MRIVFDRSREGSRMPVRGKDACEGQGLPVRGKDCLLAARMPVRSMRRECLQRTEMPKKIVSKCL